MICASLQIWIAAATAQFPVNSQQVDEHVAATHSAKYTATAALAARHAAELAIQMNLQPPSVAVSL